jgi:ferrous iron transport protein A
MGERRQLISVFFSAVRARSAPYDLRILLRTIIICVINFNRKLEGNPLQNPRHAKHPMSATFSDQTMQTEISHLALLKKGESATVTGLAATDCVEQQALRTRLLELGFAPGETIRVVAESFPRRDPMAVRIGNTTFALRRHEAAMIHVVRSDCAAA